MGFRVKEPDHRVLGSNPLRNSESGVLKGQYKGGPSQGYVYDT